MTWNRKANAALAATVSAAMLLAGCASVNTADVNAAGTPVQRDEATPHGYVEGAEETAEPQARLVIADGDTGSAYVLDPSTGKVAAVGGAGSADGGAVGADGRFAYLTAPGGRATRVIDSGAWTVDHGDHSHYYRADAREVGIVTGGRPRTVFGDAGAIALTFDDGTAKVLDRVALDRGDVVETAALVVGGRYGAVVPYGGHLLVPGTGPGGGAADRVEVRGRDGGPVAGIGEPCPEPRGAAVTRRGAVFGCADGALLVTERGGVFSGEKLRYPGNPSEDDRVREFAHRPGSTTLAGRTGDRGIWVLDLSARKWTLLKTGPAVAVTAIGDGAPVLSLTADGVLHSYDAGSGEEIATAKLLAAPSSGSDEPPAPTIQVDASRAYVNDPVAKAVHEIDYNDDLRRARTFRLGFTPTSMVETGR
ncbi:ABC transporter [Microtetraspora sp. NBRC 16547]|uniref:ABC transporter n=1 Tax=Microtetraspora sp. NBRC 16547 TaxID=3030993 RepID=UPI0024A2578A|nr:ABC transporter [Microtetraspora sp. NBRC 16547]GLW98441.1 lipoprotein [Microtetraspora sp. NBRC 16547]